MKILRKLINAARRLAQKEPVVLGRLLSMVLGSAGIVWLDLTPEQQTGLIVALVVLLGGEGAAVRRKVRPEKDVELNFKRRDIWGIILVAFVLGASSPAFAEDSAGDLAPRVGPAAWCSTEGCEEAGVAAALHRWECRVWPAGPTCSIDALAGRDSGGFAAFGELTDGPIDLGALPIVPPETRGRLHLGAGVTAPYGELDEAEWAATISLKVTLEP